MMRPLTALYLGGALYVAAGNLAPFEWSHRLTESCAWVPARGWSDLGLSRGEPGAVQIAARAPCLARRGLASASPMVRELRRQWPSEAELAAWRNDR